MINLVACDYCTQRNYDDALCCQWCGAPLGMELGRINEMIKVRSEQISTCSMDLDNAPGKNPYGVSEKIEFEWSGQETNR